MFLFSTFKADLRKTRRISTMNDLTNGNMHTNRKRSLCSQKKLSKRKQRKKPKSSFEELFSNDILFSVCSFFVSPSGKLDGATLRSIALVSKKFKTAAYSASLWKIPVDINSRFCASSLQLRDEASLKQSLMGFVMLFPEKVKCESATWRVIEKASGREGSMELARTNHKSYALLKQVYRDHFHSSECSNNISLWNGRVVRWFPESVLLHNTTEKVADITHLLKLQAMSSTSRNLVQQQHVMEECWPFIVDWIAEIVECFDLDDMVIFETLKYFDRILYTSEYPIQKHRFQLLAAACLQVANKLNNGVTLTCNDICLCSDNSISTCELQDTEDYVLLQLDWKLAFPTVLHFLNLYNFEKDSLTYCMMQYIAELILQSHSHFERYYEPSKIAGCCLILAQYTVEEKATGLSEEFLQYLPEGGASEDLIQYPMEDLAECTMDICRAINLLVRRPSLGMITRRYRTSSKRCVSQIYAAFPNNVSSFAAILAYHEERNL